MEAPARLLPAVLTAVGKHAESLLCHAGLAEDFPRSPEVRINYGNALRSMGLTQQCIEAYRDAIAESGTESLRHCCKPLSLISECTKAGSRSVKTRPRPIDQTWITLRLDLYSEQPVKA